jgi:hypothetical protein
LVFYRRSGVAEACITLQEAYAVVERELRELFRGRATFSGRFFAFEDVEIDPGPAQPGGWLYNVLPYVEKEKLRSLGQGEVSPQIEESMVSLLETPVALFNCPSRRTGGPYPVLPTHGTFRVGVARTGLTSTVNATVLARTDYAANAGSQRFNELSAGPATLAEGDDPDYNWPSTLMFNGIFYQRSAVSINQISRGTSNTVLLGERYIDAAHYFDGVDTGDNEGMYVGFDNDTTRGMSNKRTGAVGDIRFPPRVDSRVADLRTFGSAHPSGFNGVLCDGSVRVFSYNINEDVYMRLGHRNDGLPLGDF